MDTVLESSSSLAAMASQFEDLVRGMVGGASVLEMESVVRFAVAAIPGANHGAISWARDGRQPETVFSTGPLPVEVDALQYTHMEGPCVAALVESDLVWANDLETDDRFPRFAPAAVEMGVRSMLSSRLFLSRDDRAALNLYSNRAGAFEMSDLPVAAIFASYTSLLLVSRMQEDRITNLERALESNREIGVAMGILMGQRRYTREESFGHLRKASQNLNRRIRDIAEEVNRTGALPDA